jgi:hypothetical protein
LLEEVDLRRYLGVDRDHRADRGAGVNTPSDAMYAPDPALQWVILGGDRGREPRPFDLAWARSIVAQCQAAGVPVFVTQLGGSAETGSIRGVNSRDTRSSRRLAFHHTDDRAMSEWPEDLRVRQFPGSAPERSELYRHRE